VSVLTRADLDRLGVLTLGEALQFLPEVQMRLYGGAGALDLPSIRGSSPNQVLVLIDGIPVNSAMQGLFDLSTVSTAVVERVEVLRGPFSAIYGGSALGGVINVITSDAPSNRLVARGGGFGNTGASGWWSTVDRRITFSAGQFASDGARPNSDVSSTTVVGKAAWDTAAGDRLTLTINQFRSTLGVPGSTAFPSPSARQSETRTILETAWRRAAEEGEWTARTYGWSDDLRYADPASPPSSKTVTQVYGTIVQRIFRVRPDYIWVFGAEGQNQMLSDSGPVGSQQAAVGGMYVQNEQKINSRSLLSGGLRYDVHSVYGGQLNPRLGVVSVIRDDLTMRVGFGRTSRAPTFSELYFTPFNNPSLRPESAWSVDIGWTWRTPQGSEVRTTLFGTAASDLIRPNASFVPQNIGHATITGGSVEWAWPSAAGLGGTLNATVTRAIDDSSGTQLLRVPWVTVSSVLQLPISDGTLSLLTTYVGSRLDVDPATFATVQMSGYFVLGLRITQGTPAAGQWQLGVDNLGALQYEPIAGYPAAGRTAFISFTRSF
jgi:outer membrane cobalamin receptor